MAATETPARAKRSTVISVRLPMEEYLQFYWFCEANNLNFNSGLRELIKTHPATTHDDLQHT